MSKLIPFVFLLSLISFQSAYAGCDINGDGLDDASDFVAFRNAMNTKRGDANYNGAADLNLSGGIDSLDYIAFRSSMCPQVAAGNSFTCSVITGSVKCWGANNRYQLGNNSYLSTYTPVQAVGLTSGVSNISLGHTHSCVIQNGGAKCWGDNYKGQIGNGSSGFTLTAHVPTQVIGLEAGVTSISAGEEHTCAVVNGGAVCWGSNELGQLGTGNTTDSNIPVQVVGLTSGVESVAVGGKRSCAIVSGGAVKCWGNSGNGQLGLPTNGYVDPTIPQQTFLNSGVTAMDGGSWFSCAIQNGAAKCWGDNGYGQIGSTLTSEVTIIATGFRNACAVVAGNVMCWGDNTAGQFGIGANLYGFFSPVQSGFISGASAIASGFNHTCVVSDGKIQCAGKNQYGQLGITSYTANSYTPVTVLFP